jgi:hypothetical protein
MQLPCLCSHPNNANNANNANAHAVGMIHWHSSFTTSDPRRLHTIIFPRINPSFSLVVPSATGLLRDAVVVRSGETLAGWLVGCKKACLIILSLQPCMPDKWVLQCKRGGPFFSMIGHITIHHSPFTNASDFGLDNFLFPASPSTITPRPGGLINRFDCS